MLQDSEGHRFGAVEEPGRQPPKIVAARAGGAAGFEAPTERPQNGPTTDCVVDGDDRIVGHVGFEIGKAEGMSRSDLRASPLFSPTLAHEPGFDSGLIGEGVEPCAFAPSLG